MPAVFVYFAQWFKDGVVAGLRPAKSCRIDSHTPHQAPRFCGSNRDIILGVLGGRTNEQRTNEQWISQYGSSHQHPVNRACHTLGIPTILLSVPVFIASIFYHRLWLYAAALFLLGWIFQFIGHAFEGKPPEFFHDWRFLLVGVRWWWAKIHGKA
jgi:hypothetical protein